MRPRKVRRLLAAMAAGAVLAGTGIGWAAEAHADGYISDAEYAYIQTWGATAVCPTIAMFPSEGGVLGVMRGIMDDGFAADDAVDIINSAVDTYCDEHWPLLVAIGEEARGERWMRI